MFGTKVLLATDGSPESGRAARMAVGLANGLGLELHAVHVASIPSVYALSETAILDPEVRERLHDMAEQDARERLDEEVEKIREAGGKVAGAHPGVGRADAEVVRLAEEMGAGLVALGSRGFGPVRRAAMGSVALPGVRPAARPVVVVRGEKGSSLPGRILLALDGSKEAHAAARAAAEISRATGSELDLVQVLQAGPLPYPHYYAMDKYEADLERAEGISRTFLEKQAKRMESDGVTVAGVRVRTGNPDHEVVKLAEELDAGLIMLGSRGLGGVKRALLGSVSDSVVRHAHCPVLVVRGEGRE